ncbi:N-acetylmuramoyl-L-alanine amidase [Carbonactinospora thermoautotrophica]|uniref:N-acetylmuramoyl-L-alanine amidase n=1 Tax=Carbonactinospora thermoautotrophica TaxID=1469144 RepID=UPI00226E54B3|nr:N-acetylmuramoyl-L-alanine amidase [Carbonactinospora thermoautotrophica]
MRSKKLGTTLVVALLVPLLLALPRVSAQPELQPVTPQLTTLPLTGVDQTAYLALDSGSAGAAANRRPAVLTPTLRTKPFQLLGVTWADPEPRPDLAVSFRARVNGTWSDWQPLESGAADGPDPGSPDLPDGTPQARAVRGGTAPFYVGPADGVQVRVEQVGTPSRPLPRDLRLELIDPGASPADDDGNASDDGNAPDNEADATDDDAGTSPPEDDANAPPANDDPRTPDPDVSPTDAPPADAAVTAAQPRIHSRRAWGADESIRRCCVRYLDTIKVAFVHHTATSNGYSRSQVPKILRAIYAYHVKSRGWSDIGYNFLVDRFGRIWEGRAGGITKPVQGAHTGGFNSADSFGIAAIGTYQNRAPSSQLTQAIQRLIAWKLGLHFRNPEGSAVLVSAGGSTTKYKRGTRVTFHAIAGHLDAGRTGCPGRKLYARLPMIQAGVRQLMGAALWNPSVSASYLAPGGRLEIRAGVLTEQNWEVKIHRDSPDNAPVRTFSGRATPDRGTRAIRAVWDGRLEDGHPAPSGTYWITIDSWGGDRSARPYVAKIQVP